MIFGINDWMDHLDVGRRSWNMSRIRSNDTKPEVLVGKTLWQLGFRYRKHVSRLPGKPDFVLLRIKTVIFVNGCFWHQHKDCSRSTTPKSNISYWGKKLESNISRQLRITKELENSEWRVVIIWECQTKNLAELGLLIKKTLFVN